MIIYVSHHYPDLDSCMSIWLLSRFVHDKEEYEFEFVSVGQTIEEENKGKSNVYIDVDTGGGIFDHHDTNDYVCSASLIMRKYNLDRDDAIKKMIEYVLKADHGLVFDIDVGNFDLLNIIEGLNNSDNMGSKDVMKFSLKAMDGVYKGLKQNTIAQKEISKIISFNTKWGQGAALETSNRKTRYLAHRKGYIIFIYVDPKSGYKGITADGRSDVDFSEAYQRVKKKEPTADWFLHSSRPLLLCVSSKAPDKKKSSLSLDQLINLVI